jgi:environmental stress-induced protein Ves
MNWQLVALAAVAAVPWRNGGGGTRELLAWPTPGDWQVRLSVADVAADGPFSNFAGSERWFAVLEGEGVTLRLDGASHVLRAASDPFRFDGAAPVHCSLLAGATRDFNLMAPPGRSRMLRVHGRQSFAAAPGALLALYAHHGAARISARGWSQEVPAATLAWCRTTAAAQFRVDAADGLWMEVTA